MATAWVGRVSPRPQDRGRNCTLLGREPLREAKAFGQMGRWFAGDPAVSERRALRARSRDRHLRLTRMGSRRTATDETDFKARQTPPGRVLTAYCAAAAVNGLPLTGFALAVASDRAFPDTNEHPLAGYQQQEDASLANKLSDSVSCNLVRCRIPCTHHTLPPESLLYYRNESNSLPYTCFPMLRVPGQRGSAAPNVRGHHSHSLAVARFLPNSSDW